VARVSEGDGEGGHRELRFEDTATIATRWGGCGCLGLSLVLLLLMPLFWLPGRAPALRCDRATAMCALGDETFPLSALKGVKSYRYRYEAQGELRRAVDLVVENKPKDKLNLCDAPDDAEVAAQDHDAEAAIRAFLFEPKAPPVVEARCAVRSFSSRQRLIYTIAGVIFGILAFFVAAVPRRVEVTFDGTTRRLRYLVRRIALPRGLREVPFDEIEDVELARGKTGRIRNLTLIMKSGEHWALASAAIGTAVDSDLDFCKVEIDGFLNATFSG
jgi:hypothetical protein